MRETELVAKSPRDLFGPEGILLEVKGVKRC